MKEKIKNLDKIEQMSKEIDDLNLKRFLNSMQGTESFNKIKDQLFGSKFRKYEEVLPPCNKKSEIEFKDAWIVWLQNDNGEIFDLQVYFKDENICHMVDRYLDKRSYKDIGAVLGNWDQWNPGMVLFKFGWIHRFVSSDIQDFCLDRLRKIKEVNEYLSKVSSPNFNFSLN